MTPLLWLVAGLMIVAAFMLVVGYGAPALWIAVVTIGIATVVFARTYRGGHTLGGSPGLSGSAIAGGLPGPRPAGNREPQPELGSEHGCVPGVTHVPTGQTVSP